LVSAGAGSGLFGLGQPAKADADTAAAKASFLREIAEGRSGFAEGDSERFVFIRYGVGKLEYRFIVRYFDTLANFSSVPFFRLARHARVPVVEWANFSSGSFYRLTMTNHQKIAAMTEAMRIPAKAELPNG
jgi:hypothetical protein